MHRTCTTHTITITDHTARTITDRAAHHALRDTALVSRVLAPAMCLPDLAVSALCSWKIEIPGRWTFDRLIGGCAAHGEDEA
jgi:hypothetical protein